MMKGEGGNERKALGCGGEQQVEEGGGCSC